MLCVKAYDLFVLANFDNPNPNYPASHYTSAEIESARLHSDPVTSDVCKVRPSPPACRLPHQPKSKQSPGSCLPATSATDQAA
jgi:hypothetical protein